MNQVRLGRVRPKGSARTLAIAESGSVKNDDPIFFRSLVDEAARRKVLNHPCIAVQQHQRLALAVVEIVKTKTTNFQELPIGGLSRSAFFAASRFKSAESAKPTITIEALAAIRRVALT